MVAVTETSLDPSKIQQNPAHLLMARQWVKTYQANTGILPTVKDFPLTVLRGETKHIRILERAGDTALNLRLTGSHISEKAARLGLDGEIEDAFDPAIIEALFTANSRLKEEGKIGLLSCLISFPNGLLESVASFILPISGTTADSDIISIAHIKLTSQGWQEGKSQASNKINLHSDMKIATLSIDDLLDAAKEWKD